MTDDDGARRNGSSNDAGPDEDDDAPLEEAEATAAAAVAGAPVPETLSGLVARVADALGGVDRRPQAEGGEALLAGGRTFAVVHPDALDVALDGPISRAALSTGDTVASPRGSGWVRFTPRAMDRYAADRVESWLRFAHRRASERHGA